MKLTKLLALGLFMTVGMTSCLNNDNSEDSTVTYTDYLQFSTDASSCTTDDGKSYPIENKGVAGPTILKLTDGRGLSQFSVKYDKDGKIQGGFELINIADCFIVKGEAKADVPTYDRSFVQSVDQRISSISEKYMNVFVDVFFDEKIDPKKFHLYVSEVSGNIVKVTISYDGKTTKSGGQAVSFDYRAALACVREQIKPVNGKVKLVLTNNELISGEVTW